MLLRLSIFFLAIGVVKLAVALIIRGRDNA